MDVWLEFECHVVATQTVSGDMAVLQPADLFTFQQARHESDATANGDDGWVDPCWVVLFRRMQWKSEQTRCLLCYDLQRQGAHTSMHIDRVRPILPLSHSR